ncbi:MAG TPA: biotin-dependent carboxyltransferase family protein [Limnochordales bacterium]
MRGRAVAALVVLHGGLLTTVQDAGRPGHLAEGLAPAGAADRFMLACANWLVGNPAEAAALEVTLDGPVLQASGDLVMALAALEGEWHAGEPGQALPLWEAVLVRDGTVVTVGAVRQGVRAYLAVAGGIAVPPVLGSRSTHLRAGIGGLHGRALAAGDRLPVGRPAEPPGRLAGRRLPAHLRPHRRSGPIRVMAGPQADAFSRRGLRTFYNARFRVSPRADRMGVRLQGPPIQARDGYDIVSEATAPGSVQVTGDGQPLVLLAERPTTGGYPKIATVITADLDVMGQLRPGQWVRFVEVGEQEARQALAERRRRLEAVRAWLMSQPPGRPLVVATPAGVYRVD